MINKETETIEKAKKFLLDKNNRYSSYKCCAGGRETKNKGYVVYFHQEESDTLNEDDIQVYVGDDGTFGA